MRTAANGLSPGEERHRMVITVVESRDDLGPAAR
jgi:hypothetical protein